MKLRLFEGNGWVGVVLIWFLLVEAEWQGEGTRVQTRGERYLCTLCFPLPWGRGTPLMHKFFCWVLIHSVFSSRVCDGQVLTPRPLPLQALVCGRELLICWCDLLPRQTGSLCWHHNCRIWVWKQNFIQGAFPYNFSHGAALCAAVNHAGVSPWAQWLAQPLCSPCSADSMCWLFCRPRAVAGTLCASRGSAPSTSGLASPGSPP